MGIYGLLEDVGWMLGPLIGGFLWETIGDKAPFMMAGIIAFEYSSVDFSGQKKRIVTGFHPIGYRHFQWWLALEHP